MCEEVKNEIKDEEETQVIHITKEQKGCPVIKDVVIKIPTLNNSNSVKIG